MGKVDALRQPDIAPRSPYLREMNEKRDLASNLLLGEVTSRRAAVN